MFSKAILAKEIYEDAETPQEVNFF